MAVDWARRDLDHRMRVELVDPLDLTTVRGELRGVRPEGRLTLGYYVDCRTTASISTTVPVGETDGWDGLAAMRIVHAVSDYTGDLLEEVLGTFYVTGATWSEEDGARTWEYTLKGTPHGLSTNVTPRSHTVGKGASALAAMRAIFKTTSRPHRIVGARDWRPSAPLVYDAGKSYLSILLDLCDRSRNRLTVAPDGFVEVRPYTAPSQTAPAYSIAAGGDGADGMFVAGSLTGGPAHLSLPERAIVSAKRDHDVITGVAVAPAGTVMRHSRRGYGVDSFKSVTNLSPFTQRQADAVAARNLAGADTEERECGHMMRYRPLADGTVELLTTADGTRRWHVKTADLDLATWVWDMSLRGGWK